MCEFARGSELSIYDFATEFDAGTFKYIDGEYREEYGDGVIMKGRWATDHVCLDTGESCATGETF